MCFLQIKLFVYSKIRNGTFKSECQWTTNHGKIREIRASLAFLALPMQHNDNVNDKLMITFLSLTKCYRIVYYALQTNNNYTFSFEYHNLHILVSTSKCSWHYFNMDILTCSWINTTAQFLMSTCANTTYVLGEKITYRDNRTQTGLSVPCINAMLTTCLPTSTDDQAKYSIHLHFVVEPGHTSGKSN
jgi:hypothetical protein